MSNPVPNLVAKLSRKALIDLVPGSKYGECGKHSEISDQNLLSPLSECDHKAAFSKETFIQLLAEAKDRILGGPSMSDSLEFSCQGIKDALSKTECRLLDTCAEAYYREKPKNSIEFGYRCLEEFAKHYKSACITMGFQPEPFFSQQLFFEVLVEKENSLITYVDFAPSKGYGFSIGDGVSIYGSSVVADKTVNRTAGELIPLYYCDRCGQLVADMERHLPNCPGRTAIRDLPLSGE